jgi:hypothetical protein
MNRADPLSALPAAWRRRLTAHSANVDFSYPTVGSKKSTCVVCNPKHYPPAMSQSNEETRDPPKADDRNFYKVEAWSQDGMRTAAGHHSPRLATTLGLGWLFGRMHWTTVTPSRPSNPQYNCQK